MLLAGALGLLPGLRRQGLQRRIVEVSAALALHGPGPCVSARVERVSQCWCVLWSWLQVLPLSRGTDQQAAHVSEAVLSQLLCRQTSVLDSEQPAQPHSWKQGFPGAFCFLVADVCKPNLARLTDSLYPDDLRSGLVKPPLTCDVPIDGTPLLPFLASLSPGLSSASMLP